MVTKPSWTFFVSDDPNPRHLRWIGGDYPISSWDTLHFRFYKYIRWSSFASTNLDIYGSIVHEYLSFFHPAQLMNLCQTTKTHPFSSVLTNTFQHKNFFVDQQTKILNKKQRRLCISVSQLQPWLDTYHSSYFGNHTHCPFVILFEVLLVLPLHVQAYCSLNG